MQVINLRELHRNLADVVEELEATGRPALLTRSGRLVAVLSPVDEAALGRHLLGQSRRFLDGLAEATRRAGQGGGVEARPAFAAARKRERQEGPTRSGPP